MKRLSLIAALMVALTTPASASTVSSVSTNASLDPSGNLWRLGAEVARDARLRSQSRSIFRARNQNQGIRTRAPVAPIYTVGNLSGLSGLLNSSGSSGNGSSASFFTSSSSSGQTQVSTMTSTFSGPLPSGIDLSDLLSGGGFSGGGFSTTLPTVSVVPVPATLPLLAGAIALLAFVRRRA